MEIHTNLTSHFASCETVQKVKDEYRKLAMKCHPDLGDSSQKDVRTKQMQMLNDAYHVALKARHGEDLKIQKADGTKVEKFYSYDFEKETKLTDKLYSYFTLNLPLTCEVLGDWIWVTGETKSHKDALKGLKFQWHSQKLCWYWHDGKFFRRYKQNYSLNQIRARHSGGAIKQTDQTLRLN